MFPSSTINISAANLQLTIDILLVSCKVCNMANTFGVVCELSLDGRQAAQLTCVRACIQQQHQHAEDMKGGSAC